MAIEDSAGGELSLFLRTKPLYLQHVHCAVAVASPGAGNLISHSGPSAYRLSGGAMRLKCSHETNACQDAREETTERWSRVR